MTPHEKLLLGIIEKSRGMFTMTYESEPRFAKDKLALAPLIHNAAAAGQITKVTKVQANHVRHYVKHKAKKLGLKPSEVTVGTRPDWKTIADGVVAKDETIMLLAAPVRELSHRYFIDAREATEAEAQEIESCLRKQRLKQLELRTYRFDRIRSFVADHQEWAPVA